MTMETNSLQYKQDGEELPNWKEIEPYIPNWFIDNGCSFPGPRWIWVMIFKWQTFYDMSRVCRVHDALYFYGQMDGWEFSWMDKEEMDHVLWEGIIEFGYEKQANIVAFGLRTRISRKVFQRIGDDARALYGDWKTYMCAKKAQLGIQGITGWE